MGLFRNLLSVTLHFTAKYVTQKLKFRAWEKPDFQEVS